MSDEMKNKVHLPDYRAEIVQILKSDLSLPSTVEELFKYHENDIAAVLVDLQADDRKKFYEALDVDSLANIFGYVDDLSDYLTELDDEKRANQYSRSFCAGT